MDNQEIKAEGEKAEPEFEVTKPESEVAAGQFINKYVRLRVQPGDVIIVYFSSITPLPPAARKSMINDLYRSTGCSVMAVPAGTEIGVVRRQIVEVLKQSAVAELKETARQVLGQVQSEQPGLIVPN